MWIAKPQAAKLVYYFSFCINNYSYTSLFAWAVVYASCLTPGSSSKFGMAIVWDEGLNVTQLPEIRHQRMSNENRRRHHCTAARYESGS
jgi:hypothetical protein